MSRGALLDQCEARESNDVDRTHNALSKRRFSSEKDLQVERPLLAKRCVVGLAQLEPFLPA